jgi:HKD family nuclease
LQQAAGELAAALSSGDTDQAKSLMPGLLAANEVLRETLGFPEARQPRRDQAIDEPWLSRGPRLFTGVSPALWDGLRTLLWDAREADIMVAYAQPGGSRLLLEPLGTALRAGARVRLLLGSYLYGTSPDALDMLLPLVAAGASIRFLEDPSVHFHPKVYRIVDREGREHLFVGSSNLSRIALLGVDAGGTASEWNLALDSSSAPLVLSEARTRLDHLISGLGVPLSREVIDGYRGRAPKPVDLLVEPDFETTRVVPNLVQREALKALGCRPC